MSKALLFKGLFYIAVLLSFSLHVIYLTTITKYDKNIIATFERTRLCKALQMEGETIRYSLFKIYENEKDYYKKLYIIISFIITGLIIAVCIFAFTNKSENPNIPFLDERDIYLAITAFVVAWIDTILIYNVFKDMEKINKKYNSDVGTIMQVLRSINKEYPMYTSTANNPYPEQVEELYKLILARWINKNDEATFEDGKSALMYLVDNDKFQEIYEYLKLDITYSDHFLIKTIYENYCKKYANDKSVKCVSNLNDVLNSLQTYHADSEYTKHKNMIKEYLLYGIFFIACFVFPLFHYVYRTIGAGYIGFISLFIIITIASVGYYTYMFQ